MLPIYKYVVVVDKMNILDVFIEQFLSYRHIILFWEKFDVDDKNRIDWRGRVEADFRHIYTEVRVSVGK